MKIIAWTYCPASVGLFYIVNLLGLKTSSRTQNILMVVKISLIVLLISSLFKGVTVPPHGINEGKIYTYDGTNGALLLLVSLVSVFFTYGGYQQTINFGSEVKSAKTMQRGIVVGILVVLFLYLAINYTYIKVIGFDQMKNANAIGSLLFEAWFGKFGAKVFDFAMVLIYHRGERGRHRGEGVCLHCVLSISFCFSVLFPGVCNHPNGIPNRI